jgi:hypothetical protein
MGKGGPDMRGHNTGTRRGRAWWWTAGSTVLATGALVGTSFAGTAQAAYRGSNGLIAFVRNGNVRGTPKIYFGPPTAAGPVSARVLTTGTEPDWQPLAPLT